MSLSEHKKRILTGLVLAAVLFTVVWAGSILFRLFVAAATVIALWEIYQMAMPGRAGWFRKFIGLSCGVGLIMSFNLSSVWFVLSLALLLLSITIGFLFDYGTGNTEASVQDHALPAFAALYIPIVLTLVFVLSPLEQLLVVFTAIATDVGGYYAGTVLGKHKMWPTVSPHKSWEGSFGGLLATIAVCLLFELIGTYVPGLPAIPFFGWCLIALILNIAAQLGDFFESALKRSFQIKDSSRLLPGHGGLLDRIDSILFVLPVYTVIKQLIALLPSAG